MRSTATTSSSWMCWPGATATQNSNGVASSVPTTRPTAGTASTAGSGGGDMPPLYQRGVRRMRGCTSECPADTTSTCVRPPCSRGQRGTSPRPCASPATMFRALLLDQTADGITTEVVELDDDRLPDGDVT